MLLTNQYNFTEILIRLCFGSNFVLKNYILTEGVKISCVSRVIKFELILLPLSYFVVKVISSLRIQFTLQGLGLISGFEGILRVLINCYAIGIECNLCFVFF